MCLYMGRLVHVAVSMPMSSFHGTTGAQLGPAMAPTAASKPQNRNGVSHSIPIWGSKAKQSKAEASFFFFFKDFICLFITYLFIYLF